MDADPVSAGFPGENIRAVVGQVIGVSFQENGDNLFAFPLPGSRAHEPAGFGERASNEQYSIPSFWVVFRRTPDIEAGRERLEKGVGHRIGSDIQLTGVSQDRRKAACSDE